MPYKHIAAHLKKTELACRLHYHQLTHGNHRRRRASTSTSSSTSSTSSRYSMSSQLPLPSTYDPTVAYSHNGYSNISNGYSTGLNTTNSSPDRNGSIHQHHKMLLPKPASITPEGSPDHLRGLSTHHYQPHQTGNGVDTDRLHAIYNNHRSNFWGAIAAEYGSEVSPTRLEDIWRTNTTPANGTPNVGSRRPPTPGQSPNSTAAAAALIKPIAQYPTYTTATPFDAQKDYGAVGHLLGSMSNDKFSYGFGTTAAEYSTLPSLPPLERGHSWSAGGMNGGFNVNTVGTTNATAITNLLNAGTEHHERHGSISAGRGEYAAPRYH
jgi:hypothetical protein